MRWLLMGRGYGSSTAWGKDGACIQDCLVTCSKRDTALRLRFESDMLLSAFLVNPCIMQTCARLLCVPARHGSTLGATALLN